MGFWLSPLIDDCVCKLIFYVFPYSCEFMRVLTVRNQVLYVCAARLDSVRLNQLCRMLQVHLICFIGWILLRCGFKSISVVWKFLKVNYVWLPFITTKTQLSTVVCCFIVALLFSYYQPYTTRYHLCCSAGYGIPQPNSYTAPFWWLLQNHPYLPLYPKLRSNQIPTPRSCRQRGSIHHWARKQTS